MIFRIIRRNGGKPPLTYRHFQIVLSGMDQPPPPEPSITADIWHRIITPVAVDHDDLYGVPTLEELGDDCLIVVNIRIDKEDM